MKIYAIAHTWRDTDMTVKIFTSDKEALEYLRHHTDERFKCTVKDPEQFFLAYRGYQESNYEDLNYYVAMTIEII